jgi:hypothetical protein
VNWEKIAAACDIGHDMKQGKKGKDSPEMRFRPKRHGGFKGILVANAAQELVASGGNVIPPADAPTWGLELANHF